jgi:mRNA interferase MazF
MNKYLRTIVIAPLTSNLKSYPTRTLVEHNGRKGMIALDQIRTIDKIRIVKRFKRRSVSEIEKCKEVIKETFND